ncbi:MAG TPA: glyoxalase, partial [Chloroflexia bacterium]|nr:glyoxalase [Chloroflexia bacterium]
FGRNPARERAVRMGAGQTHHWALAVPDEETQLACREMLLASGLAVTPVLDRVYFRSIYMNDPDGHIVELATAGPGFAVDEDPSSLGTSLQLPAWLENQRPAISHHLRPLVVPMWPAAVR